MGYTERERALLEGWPALTGEDLAALNDLFPHYLFFRREGDLMGLGGVRLWASCCGHEEYRPYLSREMDAGHWTLTDLGHKDKLSCPWCGREVTAIDLGKAGARKSLRHHELAVVLHARGEALYADALVLRKDYADEASLTARPEAWCSSGYYFARGEVMQADHQSAARYDRPVVSWERGRLGRKRLVQEPYKVGSISWYSHDSYRILNREALEEHPFFRYCGFFDRWQYRPGGARGYAKYFHELISYLTAYAIYPRQIEMLSKAGYWEPIADLVWRRTKNAAAMCWEEDDPRRAFGVDKRELRWIMAVQPAMEALAVRNYVRKHWGETWDLAFCEDFRNLWGVHLSPMEVLCFLKRYRLEPGRFLRYLGGIGEESDLGYADLFEVYRDYLDAAYGLGRCLTHSRVLWPEDLQAAHDRVTAEWEAAQARREKQRRAASLKERRLKYEFELDGLKIVLPATAAAIRREGKSLRHCVGGYAQRHLEGTLTILFLRRSARPDKPYVTIEMDGNRIRQIHGFRNEAAACAANPDRVSPRVLHGEFLDTWLRWLRAGSKRNEDGTPKLPRRREAQGDERQVRPA